MNHRSRRRFLYSLAGLYGKSALGGLSQSRRSRTIGGVSLHPAAQRLLHNVELRSDKTLETIVRPLGAVRGHAQFGPDGTPQIFIDNKRPITEEVIVHELSHLALLLDGYPTFVITPPAKQQYGWEDWSDLLTKVEDDISHHIFFPKLRAMGYQPNNPFREQINTRLSGSALKEWAAKDLHYMAETDFRVRLEEQDRMFIRRFDQSLMDTGMQASVELAKQMAAAVGSLEHWTKHLVLDAFTRCADLFLAPYMKLQFSNWSSAAQGKIVQYIAELSAVNQRSATARTQQEP